MEKSNDFWVSRREIIGRSCPESDPDWRRMDHQPRTLPSMMKRRDSRVSRQEILQRRASLEVGQVSRSYGLGRRSFLKNPKSDRISYENLEASTLPKVVQSGRSFSKNPNYENLGLDLAPRPSTLPKVMHHGCTPRTRSFIKKPRSGNYENVEVIPRPSTLPKATQVMRVSQDAPVYGRIKRRQASLSEPRSSPGSMCGARSAKSSSPHRPSSFQGHGECGLYRTMSRRRIIDNAEEALQSKSLDRVRRRTSRSCERSRTLPLKRVQPVVKVQVSETVAQVSPVRPDRSRKPSLIPLRIKRPRKISDVAMEGVGKEEKKCVPGYSIFGICTGRRKVYSMGKEGKRGSCIWDRRPLRMVMFIKLEEV